MNFKGSDLERQAILYCKRLGINYSKLSELEFRQLIHILNKSSCSKHTAQSGRSANKKQNRSFLLGWAVFCWCRPLAGQCVQRWRNGHALMGGVRFSVSDWITSFYELNSLL